MRYTVTQIHQVTETYEVEADSREEAWEKVQNPGRYAYADQARLARTDHGKREVWEIKRAVRDVHLPLGACRHCATPASDCLKVATGTDLAVLCCVLCQHPAA